MHRDDFAMLSNNIVYFDNGATTLKPKCVRDAICKYYDEYTANAHRGDYDISYQVDIKYEGAREKVREFINAKSASEIVFTSGATQSLNMIISGFFNEYLNDFINWIENDHKLALDVLHFVSNNMYKQAVKTGEVLAYPAICTLINYLINVFESENKKEVFIEKTREEIGSILGFSVRTINRNLKVLKEENLLSVSRKGILITQKQCEKLYEKLNSIK